MTPSKTQWGVTPHHLGVAVAEIMDGIRGFRGFGWNWDGEIIEDSERNVNLAFLTRNGSDEMLELVSPLNGKSPVSSTLGAMKNVSTPYHICYEAKDIERTIEILKRRKYTITSPLKPAVAFNNRRVAFLLSRSAGLVELLEGEHE